MKNKNIKKGFLALIAAIIWGLAFVAQSVGAEHIGPFTFNALRGFIASVFIGTMLLIILLVEKGRKKKNPDYVIKKDNPKTVILGGLVCGTFLTIASNLQQYAMAGTEAGKAGFITALYIVLVPILGLFLKKKTSIMIWISVVIACVGLYLLCVTNGFSSFNLYDLALIGCAFTFAFQILSIDYFASRCNGIKLSFAQFVVEFLESAVFMLAFEHFDFALIKSCIWAILYVGIMSSGVAYTLQILAQKNANPTIISLIMSMESTFSVLFGAIILHEALSVNEYIGCVLMFLAIILAQIPIEFKKKKNKTNDLSNNNEISG